MPFSPSPIQNTIFSIIKHTDQMKYSDIREESQKVLGKKIPSDLFNYHLQFLVKKDFLIREEDGYSLSTKGRQYISDTHAFYQKYQDEKLPAFKAHLFKTNVITIASRVNPDTGELEILNQERLSQPSYGKVGVMGGVVRHGEFIEQAATRKLFQETGLHGIFKIYGNTRRIMYVGDELFSDMNFPIAYCDDVSGDLIEKTKFGRNFWVSLDQAIENENQYEFDYISGIRTFLQALKEDKIDSLPFFFTQDIHKGDNL